MIAADLPPSAAAASHSCVAACVQRVKLKRDRRELFHYKRKPMPWCTWGPESGPVSSTNPEFSGPRYQLVNYSSGAAGKFQFMPGTWRALGGTGLAQDARPVLQERLARKLMRLAGLSPWVNC